jgi:hypothetical protein
LTEGEAQETHGLEALTVHGAVEELEFTEEFLEHMRSRGTYEKHVVNVTEILEVHSGEPKYFLNSSTGRAPVIMLGITTDGRWLCVPVEPVSGRKGVWQPVTAFEANAHHRRRYEEGNREDE